MDSGVINVDINFGGANDVDGRLKKSPSHESDSGVSIMSSPEHSVISDFEDDATFNALSPPCFETFDNLLDTQLSSYLSGDNDSNDIDSEVSSILSVSPANLPTCNTDHSYQHHYSSESQVSKSNHQQTYVHTPMNTCQTQTVTSQNTLPPVKIIKVITAPKNSSRIQMEKEIVEAIEEKNKKNAKQAKINREKKKVYIKSLEDNIDTLKTENVGLKDRMGKLEHHKNALEEEVEYLKSVLANQSTLSNLLKNIPNAKVHLSSSFSDRKRGASHDHDYQGRVMRSSKKAKTAGVCLHVENENVSLEFCSSCSKNAQGSYS